MGSVIFSYFLCLDSCPSDIKNSWPEAAGSITGFWLILDPLHGQYSEKQAPTMATEQNDSYMSWINVLAILQVLTMNVTWDNRPCLSEK